MSVLNGPSYVRVRLTNEDGGEDAFPAAKVPRWLDVTWKALVMSDSGLELCRDQPTRRVGQTLQIL